MTRFLPFLISFFFSLTLLAQNKNLGDYSYVVVPDQFEFLKGNDQYQLNSMAKFYFEKSGFNAFLGSEAPNANRCDGLYANVEQLRSFLGTKLQVVLNDCRGNEVYRGTEGRSKYKEHDKSFQDALRKAFKSLEFLRIKQQDLVLVDDVQVLQVNDNKPTVNSAGAASAIKENKTKGSALPTSKFSNYLYQGKTFLLRQTGEGYSLYEESSTAADGLLLRGKIIVMDKVVKYVDAAGNTADAAFDATGNLILEQGNNRAVYTLQN
ncbi:MAG TPA: hypothetical protein VKX40_13115 [Aequorivita sp.]|nr:hypothetical protein [Aequorivita sp.]